MIKSSNGKTKNDLDLLGVRGDFEKHVTWLFWGRWGGDEKVMFWIKLTEVQQNIVN